MKLDFFKNELKEGDTVAYVESGYRNFCLGTIVKLNEQKATIEMQNPKWGVTKSYRDYDMLIKKP